MAVPNQSGYHGPAEIEIDPGGTPFTLSKFLGPVSFTDSVTLADVEVNQYGNTPWTKVSTGHDGSPKLAFVLTDVVAADLAEIFGVTVDLLENQVGNSVGVDLRTLGKEVLLKPLINGAAVADTSAWYHFSLMSPMNMTGLDIKFDGKGGTQRGYAVEMYAFPVDATTPLYSMGYNVPA